MADVRTSFVPLEDVSSQAGLPLHKMVEGEATSGKNAQGALVAKDPSGNAIYLRTNLSNELLVASNSASIANLSDEGGVVGSTSFQTLAEIALQNDYVYQNLSFLGSCFRDAVYEVVQVDDTGGTPVETIHATFRTGAGAYTCSENMDALTFTAGSTGTCVLRIRGKQLQNVASDVDGAIAIQEVQP